MNTLSSDTAYIKDKFDVKDFEKQSAGEKYLSYTDQKGYKFIIWNSIEYGYHISILPPGQYYVIYQRYDSDGYICSRNRTYFRSIKIGEWEYYDSDGNKKVEKHEFPPNKFTLDHVYAFMEHKGWVDNNAKNREYISVFADKERGGNWRIIMNNTEKYYQVDYELHRNTGRVIKKSEGYYMPVL